jgi:hypothetical protein
MEFPFTDMEVAVRPPPSATPQTIKNPLRSYTFVEGVTFKDSAWQNPPGTAPEWRQYQKGEQTVRHPGPDGSDDVLLNSNVKFAAAATWVPGVADMFSNTPDYHRFSNHFSTTKSLGTQNSSNYGYFPSVEVYHDNIHDVVGGRYGTMHYVSIASYDPLFWFHHNNAERMFVLWQMINPDAWLEPSNVVQENTMSTVINETVDGSTPILPFVGSNGEYVTSDSLRDLKSQTYTYDDVERYMKSGLTPEQVQEAVIEDILRTGNPANAYRLTYSLLLNATGNSGTDESPISGKIHVFLLPDEEPTVDSIQNGNPNYCGSINLDQTKEVKQLSIDKCMYAIGLNVYANLDSIQPPWSEKDVADPTRRFAKFDAIQKLWSTKPESFSFIVQDSNGSDITDSVDLSDRVVEYTYSTDEREWRNVANTKIANELLPDQLTSASFNCGLSELAEANGAISGRIPALSLITGVLLASLL